MRKMVTCTVSMLVLFSFLTMSAFGQQLPDVRVLQVTQNNQTITTLTDPQQDTTNVIQLSNGGTIALFMDLELTGFVGTVEAYTRLMQPVYMGSSVTGRVGEQDGQKYTIQSQGAIGRVILTLYGDVPTMQQFTILSIHGNDQPVLTLSGTLGDISGPDSTNRNMASAMDAISALQSAVDQAQLPQIRKDAYSLSLMTARVYLAQQAYDNAQRTASNALSDLVGEQAVAKSTLSKIAYVQGKTEDLSNNTLMSIFLGQRLKDSEQLLVQADQQWAAGRYDEASRLADRADIGPLDYVIGLGVTTLPLIPVLAIIVVVVRHGRNSKPMF